ncbi:MAG TPA: class II aldolase/adducin family protein [Saprospiraceae bacterium]|nr:class II aldolase/adducin family protein [Saprospiraceae bacterium]
MDEGYIKFNCNWILSNDIPLDKVAELNMWREIMYDKGWIGLYPDGIGFGNISMRCDEKTFLISGTATGGLPILTKSHYSLVTNYNLSTNTVTCMGPVKASSESLTHALIYECSAATNAVIHIHNLDLWNRLLHHAPTSSENISYGTAEMANEIKRLFAETELREEKIIVMGGHQEGIISFGRDLEEAGSILIDRL